MLFSAFGQFLDLKTSTNKYFKTFTPEKHLTIVRYKTAYYTYDLPIYLSYLLTGNKLDGKARKQVQDLNIDLGTLFQIQVRIFSCIFKLRTFLGSVIKKEHFSFCYILGIISAPPACCLLFVHLAGHRTMHYNVFRERLP